MPTFSERDWEASWERLRSDDPREAARLLDVHYRGRLESFCHGYLGDRSEAEDAAQEVLMKVLAASAPDTFRPWIWVIARNHCQNVLRARQRRRDRVPLLDDEDFTASLTGHLTGLVAQERRERLRAALMGLTELQEETLRLRHLEGLSREEIAAVQDVEVTTVKSRLFEAMKAIRSALETMSFDSR